MNQTNDELRRKIILIKGWNIQKMVYGELVGYLPNDGRLRRVPNWPENMTDAWGLVEEWRASDEVDLVLNGKEKPIRSRYLPRRVSRKPGYLRSRLERKAERWYWKFVYPILPMNPQPYMEIPPTYGKYTTEGSLGF